MKLRTTALVLALSMSLSLLSACGGQNAPASSSESASSGSASASGSQSGADLSMPAVSTPDPSAPDVSQPAASAPDQSILVEVPSLSLNKTDFTLFKSGESYQLSPIWVNGDSQPLTWSSSNEAVATVSENGTVTAVAPGTATITASQNGTQLSAQCVVRCNFKAEADVPASGSVSTPDSSAPDASAPSTSAPAAVDLNAFVSDLTAQSGGNFVADVNVVEYEMANDLYPGISDISTKQLVIYQPMMSAVVCEIALAEVSNSADVDAVKAIFQSRIDTQVNGGAWYPDSIAGWQNNSRIVSHGNYVMMIAWMYCDDAVSAFDALF